MKAVNVLEAADAPEGHWIFLRHGLSTANQDRVLSGWWDVALTEEGRRQAREAGKTLLEARFDRILTSDLVRARETAELLVTEWEAATGLAAPPLTISPPLRERQLGALQGQHLDALRATGATQVLLGWDSRPPGGESHADLAARGLACLAEHDLGGTTLVVSHGGMIRTLVGLAQRLPRGEIGRHRCENAIPVHLTVTCGTWAQLLRTID